MPSYRGYVHRIGAYSNDNLHVAIEAVTGTRQDLRTIVESLEQIPAKLMHHDSQQHTIKHNSLFGLVVLIHLIIICGEKTHDIIIYLYPKKR